MSVSRLSPRLVSLLMFAATFGAHGCVERPDADTCARAGNHMISLYRAHKESSGQTRPSKLGDKDLEAFKKSCVLRGTKKEVRCVQDAASWADVESCIQ